MDDLIPELQPFTDLHIDDRWTVNPAMTALNGTAIKLQFTYHKRLPTNIGGMLPSDNTVEIWWHQSKKRYAITGPHISETHCTDTSEALGELYQALGETRGLIERARLNGELGSIDGIGHATITRLQRTYGTIETVYDTDINDLLEVPHITLEIAQEINSRKTPRHISAQDDEHQVGLSENW